METSHFEMSELNASQLRNTAESKKKKEKERRQKKRSEKILEQKRKRTWGKRGGETSIVGLVREKRRNETYFDTWYPRWTPPISRCPS